MTFRLRIMLSILLVTISGLSVFFFFTYYVATDQVGVNYAKSLKGSMQIRMDQIDGDMREVYQKTVALSVQPELSQVIQDYSEDSDRNADDVIRISEYLRQQNDSPDLVDALFLYITKTEQVICSQEYRDIIELQNSSKQPFTTSGGIGLQPWVLSDMSGNEMRMIYLYTKPVYSETGEHIGTIGLSISERAMYFKLLDSKSNTEEYFLLDGAGQICSAGQGVELETPISELIDISWNTSQIAVGIGQYNGKKSVCAMVESSFSGFTLLCISEHAELVRDLKQTQWLYTLVLLAVIILAVVLADKISGTLNKPLKNLMYAMDRVGSGDFGIRTAAVREDEFFQLNNRFNGMVTQIDGLISQVIDEQRHARQAELNALQYQIKPHFMYNTLNSIKYMAFMQGNESLGKQLASFIELLEASLNKGSDFSTLEFEVRLIEDYVSLQMYRYMGCFMMEYDITDDANACYVPRFLLQPLVENSILHGMDTKRNDNVISISAYVEEGILHIEAKDNGKGMSEEQKNRILHQQGDTSRQFNGIGVYNTVERLRLFYGKKMHVEMQTEMGIGTRYIIELPASQEAEGAG